MGVPLLERWPTHVASTARRPAGLALDARVRVEHQQGQQEQQEQEGRERQRHAHCRASAMLATATPPLALDSVHQTGTRYRSNSAGDGPEKTRDRKSWFPRFKSNWLGTFRSKQMFPCCECAVLGAEAIGAAPGAAARYKGAEGKHCRCGKDQWHLAKTVEETEYNRRMEVSKALGGMRYDEAVLRLRSMGTSEDELTRMAATEQDAKRLDASDPALGLPPRTGARVYPPVSGNAPKCPQSVSSDPGASLTPPNTRAYTPQLIKSELGATYPSGVYSPLYATASGGEYTQSVGVSTSSGPPEYEQLTPAPYGDEEGFSELLQGILEDDPRAGPAAGLGLSPNGAYAPGRYAYAMAPGASGLKRTMSAPAYAMTETPATANEMAYYQDPSRRTSTANEMAYYQDPSRRTSTAPSLSLTGNQPTQYHHYQMPPQPSQQQQQPPPHLPSQQFHFQQQQQHPPQQQQAQSYGHSLPVTSNASF